MKTYGKRRSDSLGRFDGKLAPKAFDDSFDLIQSRTASIAFGREAFFKNAAEILA